MEIIALQKLQQNFDSATENSLNRKMSIEFEIKAIENFVNNIPAFVSPFKRTPQVSSINKSPQIFTFDKNIVDRILFNKAFYEYLINGKILSIVQEQNANDESFIIKQKTITQSIEAFKYYEWLKKQLNTNTKTKPSISLNHQEKMLALHLLGMDTSKFDDNKIAKILSAILGLDEQNTRKILGTLYIDAVNNPVRNKKHFENLQNQFQNIGLNKIAEDIKDKIKNLK